MGGDQVPNGKKKPNRTTEVHGKPSTLKKGWNQSHASLTGELVTVWDTLSKITTSAVKIINEEQFSCPTYYFSTKLEYDLHKKHTTGMTWRA